MPLVPSILVQSVKDLITNKAEDPSDSSIKFAKAYFDYAKKATSFGTSAIFTGLEQRQMANALIVAFSNPKAGSPSKAANGIVKGLTAFWLTPPVVFGYGPVTSFLGSGVLLNCLISSFTNPKISEGLAAKKLANCLDAATRTVFTTGVSGPQPLV